MHELDIEKCRFLRSKYPDCYPIVLENTCDLIKPKLIVPKTCTVSNLMCQIRKYNKLNTGK